MRLCSFAVAALSPFTDDRDRKHERPRTWGFHAFILVPGGCWHSGQHTFYCFVVRAACGACLIIEGLDEERLKEANPGQGVFLTPERRELCRVRAPVPAMSHQTMVVNLARRKTATAVIRFREIIAFDSDCVHSEYLFALPRVSRAFQDVSSG